MNNLKEERRQKIMSATRKQLDVLLGDNAFFTVKEVAKAGKCSLSKVYKMSIREGQENRTGGYRMKFFINKANKLVTTRDDVIEFLDWNGYVD